MLIYPPIDPVALQIGPLAIHWYGLTYLAAFGLFMFLGTLRLRHPPFAAIQGTGAWTRRDVEREFGPPASIDAVGNWNGPILTYRWNDGTDMFYWVYLDANNVVRRAHPGMELRNSPEWD